MAIEHIDTLESLYYFDKERKNPMRQAHTAESTSLKRHATSIAEYVRLETIARKAGAEASHARRGLSPDDLLEANFRLETPRPRRKRK